MNDVGLTLIFHVPNNQWSWYKHLWKLKLNFGFRNTKLQNIVTVDILHISLHHGYPFICFTCFCGRLLISILLAQKSQNNNQVNFWLVLLNECVSYKQHDTTRPIFHVYNQQETILLFRQEYTQLQIICNIRREQVKSDLLLLPPNQSEDQCAYNKHKNNIIISI